MKKGTVVLDSERYDELLNAETRFEMFQDFFREVMQNQKHNMTVIDTKQACMILDIAYSKE